MKTMKRYALLVGALVIAGSACAQKPAGDGSVIPTNDSGAAMGGSSTGDTGSACTSGTGTSESGRSATAGSSSVDQTTRTVRPSHGKATKARREQSGTSAAGSSGASGSAGTSDSAAGKAINRPSQPGGVSETDPSTDRTPGGVGAGGDSTGLPAPNPAKPSSHAGTSTQSATPLSK